MRVILDECLPSQLKKDLSEHEVSTVRAQGWSGLKNGELLQVASGQFDIFLTADRNIPFQQNLKNFHIAVVVIASRSILLRDLRPFMAEVREALPRASPGQLIVVGAPRRHDTLKERSAVGYHFRLNDSPYSAAVSRSVLMTSWASGVR